MVKFQRARRESIGLLIGIAGPSGGGKTYTAMELATGLAGGEPFAVIDTEAGRAKHYADRFTFDHADITAPFRPDTYLEAIEAADKAGYPVIVVDSMSHEHAGDGGLLDWHEDELERMAGNDWQKRERVKFAAWIKPKGAHKRMVSKLLQVRAHLILCFRAEQKTEMPKKGDRETKPKRLLSGFVDWIPIAEKNLLYELTTSFLVLPDRPGVPVPIKIQEQHRTLFPDGKPVGRRTGEKLAEWSKGVESGGATGRQAAHQGRGAPAAPPDSQVQPGSAGDAKVASAPHSLPPEESQEQPAGSGCSECASAGRDQCSVHAGEEGVKKSDLPKAIADAIANRRLVDSATEELTKLARGALADGKSHESVLKAIAGWNPGGK